MIVSFTFVLICGQYTTYFVLLFCCSPSPNGLYINVLTTPLMQTDNIVTLKKITRQLHLVLCSNIYMAKGV